MIMQTYITALHYAPLLPASAIEFGALDEAPSETTRVPWIEVPLSGLASMTHEQEWDAGTLIHDIKVTAILVRRTEDNLPFTPRTWMLTTADGRRLILGDARPPVPQCLLSMTAPDRPGGEAYHRLTLSLRTARRPFIPYTVHHA